MMVQRKESVLRPGDSTVGMPLQSTPDLPLRTPPENSATCEEEELLSSGTLAHRPRPPGHTPPNNKLSEVRLLCVGVVLWSLFR